MQPQQSEQQTLPLEWQHPRAAELSKAIFDKTGIVVSEDDPINALYVALERFSLELHSNFERTLTQFSERNVEDVRVAVGVVDEKLSEASSALSRIANEASEAGLKQYLTAVGEFGGRVALMKRRMTLFGAAVAFATVLQWGAVFSIYLIMTK